VREDLEEEEEEEGGSFDSERGSNCAALAEATRGARVFSAVLRVQGTARV